MEKKSNGLGIASMVLGIIALLFSCCYGGFLGLIGLPLGIAGATKPNKGTAIAGIITSSFAILFSLGLLMMGNGSLVDYIERSKDSATENNISTEELSNTEAPVETNGAEITLDEFNSIETGMTYQEVVDIIGSEGTLSSENTIGDTNTKMYIWYGKDGLSNANFIFSNDSLTSKAQLGLK